MVGERLEPSFYLLCTARSVGADLTSIRRIFQRRGGGTAEKSVVLDLGEIFWWTGSSLFCWRKWDRSISFDMAP